MTLIGKKAPDFTTAAVMANGEINDKFNLHQAIENKYGILFFYPLDFTFVCPSELIALDHRIDEFKQRNTVANVECWRRWVVARVERELPATLQFFFQKFFRRVNIFYSAAEQLLDFLGVC